MSLIIKLIIDFITITLGAIIIGYVRRLSLAENKDYKKSNKVTNNSYFNTEFLILGIFWLLVFTIELVGGQFLTKIF